MPDTIESRLREALAAIRNKLRTTEAKRFCDKLMGNQTLNPIIVKDALAELKELSSTTTNSATILECLPLQITLEYYLNQKETTAE